MEGQAPPTSFIRHGSVLAGVNVSAFPRNVEATQGDRPVKTSVGHPWQSTIQDSDLRYMVRRDELAARALEKWAGDSFNKWFNVRADGKNEKVRVEVETIMERLNVRSIYKMAYEMAFVDGFSLIALGWAERNKPEDLSLPPNGVSDILYINAISKPHVDDIIIDKNPTSETYGEIKMYKIKIPVEDRTEVIDVHPQRFLLLTNKWIDNDPMGQSRFLPSVDKMTIKKNMDLSLAEVIRQQAKNIPVVRGPRNASKEEVDAAETCVRNLNIRSYLMFPEDFSFELVGTNSALNPEPYTKYLLSTLSAGLAGGKVALLGTEAGAVTGSEYNVKEWYNTIRDEQKTLIEPWLTDLLRVLSEFKVIKGDISNIWFEWNSLQELNEREIAELQELRAKTLHTYISAFALAKQTGFTFSVENDLILMENETGVSFTVPAPGVNTRVKGISRDTSRKSVHRSVPGASGAGPILDDMAHEKLFSKWEVRTRAIENKTADKYQTHVTKIATKFMDALKNAWAEHVKPVDFDPNNPTAGKNDDASFIEEMEAWAISTNALKADIIAYLEEAYTLGAQQTLSNMGIEPTVFRLSDTKAVKVIQTQGLRLAKNTYLDMHTGAMNAIMDGLMAGEDYSAINDRVAKYFSEYSKGIPNTVQKFVHEASSEARFDTMESMGVERFIYLTARDGRVRPEHEAMEGQIVTRDEAMPYLSDFGCRCTIVPYTVYSKEAGEGKEGLMG